MYQIDRWAHANRWYHRHVVEKLTLAFGMLLLSLLLPWYPGGVIIFVIMAVAAVGGAGIPPGVYLRLLAAPAGFALAGAAPMAATLSASPAGGWYLGYSPVGAEMAGGLLVQALAAVSCLYFLALTTPMVDLVTALRRCRVPEVVTELMVLIYRFLFLLSDTLESMRTAQSARLGNGSLVQSRRSLSLLAASLFGHVLSRARRLEMGLAARGYDGRLAVLAVKRPISRPVLLYVITLELTVAAISTYLREGRLWQL